jgi:hypothetical protein
LAKAEQNVGCRTGVKTLSLAQPKFKIFGSAGGRYRAIADHIALEHHIGYGMEIISVGDEHVVHTAKQRSASGYFNGLPNFHAGRRGFSL